MSWLSDIDIFQQTPNTDDSQISLPLLWMFLWWQHATAVRSNEVYSFCWVQKQTKHKEEEHQPDFSILTTHFIIELHFNNGFADAWHRSSHINICSFIMQPAAASLRADEVTGVLPIIQLVVQMFVAGTGMLDHTHGQAVLVQVVVKGHRKHDGHAFGTNPTLHVEQVVGQQADGARGSVVILGEGAHLGLGGTNRGLRRVLTEAARHVHPAQERGWQILTVTTNQSISFMSHSPDFWWKTTSFVSFCGDCQLYFYECWAF